MDNVFEFMAVTLGVIIAVFGLSAFINGQLQLDGVFDSVETGDTYYRDNNSSKDYSNTVSGHEIIVQILEDDRHLAYKVFDVFGNELIHTSDCDEMNVLTSIEKEIKYSLTKFYMGGELSAIHYKVGD